jgi:transposase
LLLALSAPKAAARTRHQKWTPNGATKFRHRLPPPDLRGFRPPLTLDHLKELGSQVDEIETQIQAWHRASDLSSRLAQVPGIGPITASALGASIGDAKNFDDGRQLAAWLGLVPRQHSSGGKSNLLGMSKRGDSYLRTLLIHGARSVIYRAGQKADACSWINAVVQRRNKNVAAVALANKNARIVWALLAHDRRYETEYRRPAQAA